MALLSFCGLLTLQVGVAMLAVVFFTVASLTMAINLFDYHNNPINTWPIPLVLVIIFVALMVLAGIIMFCSAYNENRNQCIAAVAVIVLVMGYWIVLSCFSFANNPRDLRRVCVRYRCGESFWLADLKYREGYYENGTANNHGTRTTITTTNTITSTTSTTTAPVTKQRRKRIPDYLNFYDRTFNSGIRNNMSTPKRLTVIPDSDKEYNKYNFVQFSERFDDDDYGGGYEKNDVSSEGGSTRYIFGLPMVGAIVLFVINFLFFLFAILIMWSYAQELRWADYYENDPPYIVDEN